MPNPYVNKVVQSNGTTLIDISDTTAVAADVASGKYFYLATGEKVEGTASGGGDEPSGPTYETYFDDSITIDAYISIPSLAELYFAEGETWRVTWDGVEYICDTAIYQGWLWTIGNQSLASTDDGLNEPFCLYNYGSGAMNGNARTGGTHTLKLEKQTSSGGGGGGSTNPLSGKILSATGDSIAAGAGNNGSGYPELVASDNNMTLQNVAVGGGTVAYVNANTFCISRSISSMRSDADFVLLEGGGNDADSGVPLGTLSSGYTVTLDDTTFAGAIESMFKSALARFPDKKIGYVFIHKCASGYDSRVPNSYYGIAKSACEKWGIPYLDLNTQVPPLNYIADLKSTYTANGDGYHPNELGYRTFYVPKITAFLNTMLTDNSLINKIVTENGTYSASDDSADGYSSVTVNVPSSAASSWTKVAETSYQVSTTSTSSATVDTWATGHSELWTSDKIVYVRVRDTAGKRTGYFYGSDTFFINHGMANGTSASSYANGVRQIFHVNNNGEYETYAFGGTSGYGVYPDTFYSDGRIRIRRRYNANYSLTINSTYKVEVYLLDPPTGAPIFT
jgi:lysophospholipase L1-like esterase